MTRLMGALMLHKPSSALQEMSPAELQQALVVLITGQKYSLENQPLLERPN